MPEKDGGICSGLPTETRSCNTQNCPCKFPENAKGEKITSEVTFKTEYVINTCVNECGYGCGGQLISR